jgi:hypothetical protein
LEEKVPKTSSSTSSSHGGPKAISLLEHSRAELLLLEVV